MAPTGLATAIALFSQRARAARHAAFRAEASPVRTALQDLAQRWDIIAEAERRAAVSTPANEA